MKNWTRLLSVLTAATTTTAVAWMFTLTPAQAAPPWGNNCASCHPERVDGSLTVIPSDGTVDPDESDTGAPDRGTLPLFKVVAGGSRTLVVTVDGLEPGDRYAVELTRLRQTGVENGHQLVYTEDCTWPYWGSPGRYFTEPALAYIWGADPDLFTFEIGVPSGEPSEFYDVVFALAGMRAADGELFATEEHFYLEVVVDDTLLFADGFEGGNTSRWAETVGGGP